MRDAQKRQKAASPPWERIFEVDFDALARRSGPLPSELSELLRLFDGTRTLRAVVDASDGDDGLKRFGALEREKLLATAVKAPSAVADEDDEALDAWLAEDAPAASRPWLRWSIAPAALVLAVAVVALLRPAARPAVADAAGASAAIAAASNANSASPTSEAKDTKAAAAPVAHAAAPAAAPEKPAAVVTATATAVSPVVGDQPAPVAPVAAPAPVAPAVTAKADVAPAAKIDAPKVDAPAKEVTPKVAAKIDAPAAKIDAPVTVLASASAPVKPSVVPATAPGVGGNGAVEKGGATVAPKTSAPAAAAASATGAADPARYAALLAEGKSRYAKGQWKAARTAYLAAMQLDPSRTDALVPLARCQLDSGALDDAFGNARRAIAVRGDDADAWLIVGAVEQQRSHSLQARTAYQKYLTLAPNAAYAADVRAVLRTLH